MEHLTIPLSESPSQLYMPKASHPTVILLGALLLGEGTEMLGATELLVVF
eukprot:SAG31_NODE_30103_length_385_cov_0.902098_1_plen_49_part_01